MRSRFLRDGVRRLFRLPLRTRSQVEADANDELRAFLAERVDDLVAQGMSPDDAHREALSRLGGSVDDAAAALHHSATHRERRMHTRGLIGDLQQDLRYAVRTLRRDVGFTAFAIAIIALGIGASATVFSVASALLFRPLPFAEPNRLAWIQNGNTPGLSTQTAQVNPYLSFARENRSFAEVAGYMAFYGTGDITLTTGDDAIRLSAVPVTENFFPMLGVHPVLGRQFTHEESLDNSPPVVMLSYALWRRQFSSERGVVGTTVRLNGRLTTIIGVLPSSFDFGSVFAPGARIDLYQPFPTTAGTNRWGNTLAMVGRLRPGVTLASATAELKTLVPRIASENPNTNSFSPTIASLRDRVSGQLRSGLAVLAMAVGVVMLIVCANLSNLLLARATTRQKEMAVRAALGAGRGRLLRQMLTESIALSACGSVLGLALAWLATRTIAHMDAVNLPLLATVALDARAIAFTVALALVAGVAFGAVPALHMSETRVQESLKASGRAATDGRRGSWLRRSLVVSEVALACVLVVSTGLLIRSFLKVLDVDLGFRPERSVALRIDPDAGTVDSIPRLIAFVDEALALTRAVPGVAAASVADGLPLGTNRSWGMSVGGEEYVKGRSRATFIRIASDGFVDAMGMTLIAGRDFTRQDVAGSDPVIIINQTVARTLWPGQSALGKMVRVGRSDSRVVGIVGDVRHLSLEEAAGNEIYLPLRQVNDYMSLTLIVRTKIEPTALARTLRATLAPIVPHLATNEVVTLQDVVDRSVSPRRFFTLLLGGFSLFAVSLALLGIYGVISYTVTHRTQEIGVRIALGASSRQVQARVLRETMELAIAGMIIGTFAAWVAARALTGFLFGVTAADPMTYVAMVVVLGGVAAASGYLPARRASRIDPIVALRES
jgi:predicted permease